MACGTPVIALNKGGTKETIQDGINGVHFKNQDINSIIDAVNRFENMKFDSKSVRDTTLKYINFKDNFEKFVNDKINKI
jgi:glycosyltransferase involved in cell wall biosynthesis